MLIISAYYWVDTVARGGIPSTALHGGVDIDGHQIYVGRAYHDGDWIPAKVIPGKQVAYVAYGGEEIAVDNFQVKRLTYISLFIMVNLTHENQEGKEWFQRNDFTGNVS